MAHKLKGQVAYFGGPVLHTQLDELKRSARRATTASTASPYCWPFSNGLGSFTRTKPPAPSDRPGRGAGNGA